jgi:glucose-6-phosphate 1-dehydrogenase
MVNVKKRDNEEPSPLIPENNTIVIFGASGDLTHRKLIPAFYHLYVNDLLPQDFAILGASRTEFTDQAFRDKMKQALLANSETDEARLSGFCDHLYYQPLNTSDKRNTECLKSGLLRCMKSMPQTEIPCITCQRRPASTV